MNDLYLIEKLGGYEVAKNAVQNYRDAGDNITMGNMESALLTYRREHGIYEVGDPVVSRCNDNENRIFTYKKTIGKNILVNCKKGKGYCYPKKWFSHATDEEIKAGHRL